jgi:hypothetical protein
MDSRSAAGGFALSAQLAPALAKAASEGQDRPDKKGHGKDNDAEHNARNEDCCTNDGSDRNPGPERCHESKSRESNRAWQPR